VRHRVALSLLISGLLLVPSLARAAGPTRAAPRSTAPAAPSSAPTAGATSPPPSPLSAKPTSTRRVRIAVLDVQALEGVSATTAKVITELIATDLQNMRRYDVISRADVASMLGFQLQKKMLGCAEDAACMAEIGGALGSDYVLTGQVAPFGTRYRFALALQDVKKAKVVSRQGSFCDRTEDALVAAAQQALANIFRELESGGALPPPTVKRPAPAETVAANPPPRPASRLRIAGYTVGGIGLATLAAGGVFDYLAYSAYQDEKKAGATGDASRYSQLQSASQSRGQAAKVLYIGGAAALGTGVALFYLGAPKPALVLDARPVPGGAVAVLSGSLP